MKIVKIIILIVSIGLISWKVYAKDTKMNSKDNGKTVTLILDEKEDIFKKRMAKELSSETYPVGATFHKFKFPNMGLSPKENKIILKVADSSLTFEYAMSYAIRMAHIRKANNISMSFGMGEGAGGVMHEEAKARMYKILEQIVDAEWKRYIGITTPRLCGAEVLKAKKDYEIFSPDLDENYFMNFKEWFSLSAYHWSFYYKNEAIMNVTLHRQGADKDLEKPGGYFLSIDVKSIEHALRSNFKPEVRDNWRELWLKELPRYQQLRIKKEQKVIAKSYHICTDYEDAPRNKGILPPLSKDEVIPRQQETPDIIIKSGELCPKSGLWQAFLPQGHPKAKLIAQSNSHTIHCAKDTHILKFELSAEDEAQVRWKFISENQESYDPNK